MRRLLIGTALLVLSAVLALTLTLADASVSHELIHVSPRSGTPRTVFVLVFRTPQRTGRHGSSQRHDFLTASAPKTATGCVTSIDIHAPDGPSGGRIRVSLDPRKLGGSWCPGAYHGRIEERQSSVCRSRKPCPTHLLTHGIVGRFTLQVKRRIQRPTPSTPPPSPGASPPPPTTPPPDGTDATAPTFSGLRSAYFCAGGPIQPAETTPYTLTWQAATDDVTPSTQIVYDVFVAHASGGEDFSHPTWTTPPGATTYTTPNLPSEGTFFVVRARDHAGNEDKNRVERLGYQICA